MKRMITVATVVAELVGGALAADLTWTGAASAVWDKTTANWQDANGTACVWADGSLAVFPSSAAAKAITLGAAVSATSLRFDPGDWSIGGGQTLTLTVGTLEQSSAGDTSLTLRDGATISAPAGSNMNLQRLDIQDATFTTPNRFHNNWNNGQAKGYVNIRAGGTLTAKDFVLSPGTTSAGWEDYVVSVYTNGVLNLASGLHSQFQSKYGTLHSDGGEIQGGALMNGYSSTTKFTLGPGGVRFTGSSTQRFNVPMEGVGSVVYDNTGVTYLRIESDKPASSYTGGTRFTKNVTLVVSHDRNFGAVPDTVASNLFVDANVSMLSECGSPVFAPTRGFVIAAGATLKIAGNGTDQTMTIRGPVTGTNHYAAANGTLSTDTSWPGKALALEPAAGVTNRIGRLIVKGTGHDLIVAGEGVTEVNAKLTSAEEDKAALVVNKATLSVTNGLLVVTNSNWFANRGRVVVSGGVADFSGLTSEYLNGFRLPGTTTVCRVGTLVCNNLRLGQDQKTPEAALLRLEKGGTIVMNDFIMTVQKAADGTVTNLDSSAQIDWDGGILAPRGTSYRSNFLGATGTAGLIDAWHDRVRVYVREGGAVVSNNCEIRIRQPLLCGVAEGKTDGGFTKWGTAMMAFVGSNLNTFNGPVNVEQGMLTMGSTSNFPPTTVVNVRAGATFNGNGMTQTLAVLGGTGRVINPSALTLTDAFSPGYGAETLGTLTVAAPLAEMKDGAALQIDLDAEGRSDCLSYAGALDLSKMRLTVNDLSKLNTDCRYVIASGLTACTGDFASTNLPKGWQTKTTVSGGAVSLTLFFQKGTMLIFR